MVSSHNATLLPYDNGKKANIYTNNASSFKISSSNPSVVSAKIAYLGASSAPTGTYNGWQLTALKPGTATITLEYGSFKRTIKVTVSRYSVSYDGTPRQNMEQVYYKLQGKEREYVTFVIYDNTSKKYLDANELHDHVDIWASDNSIASNSYASADNGERTRNNQIEICLRQS